MTPRATAGTARTLRRHHSTDRLAAANTGIIHSEWELTVWTMDPLAMALATPALVSRTSNTIRRTPSAVRIPASTQSPILIPRNTPVIAAPSPSSRRSGCHGGGGGLLLAHRLAGLLVHLNLHEPSDPIEDRRPGHRDRHGAGERG